MERNEDVKDGSSYRNPFTHIKYPNWMPKTRNGTHEWTQTDPPQFTIFCANNKILICIWRWVFASGLTFFFGRTNNADSFYFLFFFFLFLLTFSASNPFICNGRLMLMLMLLLPSPPFPLSTIQTDSILCPAVCIACMSDAPMDFCVRMLSWTPQFSTIFSGHLWPSPDFNDNGKCIWVYLFCVAFRITAKQAKKIHIEEKK